MSMRIALLKHSARVAYEKYYAELSTLSCGRALGEHVNPRMAQAKKKFNETMDKLAKLDPETPAQRL